MKTKLIILGLLVVFAVPAFAQLDTSRSNKNEFSYGYGIFPASSNYYPINHYNIKSDHFGAMFFTYTRRLNKVIGIGVTFCFDPVRLTYFDMVNGQSTPICKVSENCFTLMSHLKLNWLNTKYVNLYSKVAVQGFHYYTYKQEEYYPELYEATPPNPNESIVEAFQFTPIGIDVGTKQYAGFMQVGYGKEGTLCIGFRYGLRDKE